MVLSSVDLSALRVPSRELVSEECCALLKACDISPHRSICTRPLAAAHASSSAGLISVVLCLLSVASRGASADFAAFSGTMSALCGVEFLVRRAVLRRSRTKTFPPLPRKEIPETAKRKHCDISASCEEPSDRPGRSSALGVARGSLPFRFWMRPPPAGPQVAGSPKTARHMKSRVRATKARRCLERSKFRRLMLREDVKQDRFELCQDVVLLQADLLRVMARESFSIARRQRVDASYARLYDRYTAMLDFSHQRQPQSSEHGRSSTGSAGSAKSGAASAAESTQSSQSGALAISNGGSPPG